MSDMALLGYYMVGVATLSSVLYAWRKRDREHAILAGFFGLTLAIDLIRLPLNAQPPHSVPWRISSILFLVQFATMPALVACVLGKRSPWPVLIGLAVAIGVFVIEPRSVSWLFKVCDVAAALAALTYTALWLRRPDSKRNVATVAVVLVMSVTAVGVFGHDVLLRNAMAWRAKSAVVACILLGIVVAQLWGVLANGET